MKLDLFGIRKRKEAARIREEQIFTIIKKEYQILKERADKEADQDNDSERKWIDKFNSICPHCKSTNVNDRIQRTQGEFHGSTSGSIFGFGGYSSGNLDTNEVNKCNDCGNEWKKKKCEYTYDHKKIKRYFERISWLCKDHKEAITAKVNKNDLNEKFNSDEEKRKVLLKSFQEHAFLPSLKLFFSDISIETIEYLAKQKETWLVYFGDLDDDYSVQQFKEFYDPKVLEEYLGLKHTVLINTSELK